MNRSRETRTRDLRAWIDTLRHGEPDALPDRPARVRAAVTFAASLEFESIERRYPKAVALRDVSLRIEAGEIVCLLGPSGCGKTTLLRLASGIDTPTAGRVLLNDREVAGPNSFVPPEHRNVGLMFQDFALFPHLTILDNIAFGLKGLGRREAAREAFAVLTRVGLGRYAREYPHVLSGGQQQRVALARAIVPRPSVILMDEPFSGLDVQLRETMRSETLALLKETRSTCMIVTHDPVEAMQLGDRVAVMRDGRVIQAGRAEDLYHHPADLFVARMFSEVNELPGVVTAAGVETPFGTFPAPGMTVGDSVVLCVRRRAVWLAKPGEGIHGRVLETRFRGDLTQLSIGVSGLDRPLSSLVREAQAPHLGDDVTIRVDPAGIMVFPADPSE
ncbi:MAG: ABC transporter ATP-binding protein [Hyphomicrobiaceae bacterium]|nr:ABC transporter ATP-binding protein [Hyphomicrobiaceae bacterium]